MMRKIVLGAVATLFLLGASCISFGSAPSTLGMYRSADKGENWQSINVYPTAKGVLSLATVSIYRTYIDPSDHNAIYLATRGQGVFYSLDRGNSWQSVAPLSGRFIYSIAIDPADKCSIYATDGAAIFKSTDCTRTWKTIYTAQSGGKLVALAIDYGNPEFVYAALENSAVLESTNAGLSWRVIKNFNGIIRDLQSDPATPGRLYVSGSTNGMSRSDDGGQTWQYMTSGLQNFAEGLTFYRLVIDPSQKDSLYWLSKYGIFHSTDAGATWSEVKLVTAPGSVNIYNLAVNPKNGKEIYYTGTVYSNQNQNQAAASKLYKSVDGGVTWSNRKLPSSAVPVSLFVHPDDPSILYAGFTSL